MKRILTILLCCLLLTACAQTQPTPTQAPSAHPAATSPTAAIATEQPTEAPLLSFTLYYGDDHAENFLSREVQVPEIRADVVIAQLISAGVLTDGVAVNSLSKTGDLLTVDFNQAFGSLVCSMGTSGERIIVGSVVNTFLNAFQAASLRFTVDGEILESGHVIYDFPLDFME